MEYFVKESDGTFKLKSKEELLKELLKPIKVGDTISNIPDAIGAIKARIKNKRIESFIVIFVNNNNQIIKILKTSTGIEDQCPVYPKDLIRKALMCYATGMLVAHNHPTGDLQPSKADREITRQIHAACKTMEIRLLDHLILGNGYYSFRENGLIF